MTRYFNFSSTILSLLIALIAVATALIPVLKEQFLPQVSKVDAVYQYADREGLFVWVTNKGTRPGSLGTMMVTFPRSGVDFNWQNAEESAVTLNPLQRDGVVGNIGAQLATQIAYSPDPNQAFGRFFKRERLDKFKRVYGTIDCRLSGDIFQFDGRRTVLTIAIPCKDTFALIEPLVAKNGGFAQ